MYQPRVPELVGTENKNMIQPIKISESTGNPFNMNSTNNFIVSVYLKAIHGRLFQMTGFINKCTCNFNLPKDPGVAGVLVPQYH